MESSKRAAPSVPPPQDDPLGPHYPCLCLCGCAGRYRGTSEVCMVCRVRESCVTLRHAFDTMRGAVRLHRRVYGTDPVNKRNWAYLCGLVLDDRDRLREELTELDTAARELLENARQQIQALTAPSVPPVEAQLSALVQKWRAVSRAHDEDGARTGMQGNYVAAARSGLTADVYKSCALELEKFLAAIPSPQTWQPISSAPKQADAQGFTPHLLLGFAPDEENYTLSTREGFWFPQLNRWASVLDPNWRTSPQPTHWMPLPDPPVAAARGGPAKE